MPQAAVKIYRLVVQSNFTSEPYPMNQERVAGQSGEKLLIKSDSPKESRKAIN